MILAANAATKFQSYKNYKLPATMDYKKYGRLLHIDTQNLTYLVQITPLTIAKIKLIFKDGDWISNNVGIIKNGSRKLEVLKYEDLWLDDRHFKRIVGDNTFYFSREGDIDLFTVWIAQRSVSYCYNLP